MKNKKLKFKLESFIATNWLVLVLILVFLLRLPSLFEPFTYGDEGIYLTLGQAVRRGLVWYRDIHDNKPPMLYLLAALAGDFSTYRLILFFWSFATIFVFYKLSQLLFSKSKLAVTFSTTIFAILTSIHTFEGNVGNAENFMLLPTIVAFYLLLKQPLKQGLSFGKIKHVRYLAKPGLLAGMLLGLATLFKVPAAFDFAAALVFVFLLDPGSRRALQRTIPDRPDLTKKKNYKLSRLRRGSSTSSGLITNNFLLLLGFFLPLLLTIVYYASKGALNQYLTAAFFQNIPYLSSWGQDKPQAGGLPLALLGRGVLVLTLVLGLYIFRKRVSLAGKLILIWFAFSWLAALLSSRPYPHYLIQVLPAFSLSFGLFFSQQKKYLKEKIIPTALLAILITTWVIFHFWHYANLSYYLNFYQYVLGTKSRTEYFTAFDPQTPAIYRTAHYLQTHTLPNEKIFIWGTDPSVYTLSRRLPVGRYTVAYHIIDFDGFEETMGRLKMEPPRYIILMASETRPFPELFAFVTQNYTLEKTIGDAQIYHRLFFP